MCVHIPCGYSLQTIIKAIASFEIILSLICLLLFGVFGSLVLAYPAYVLSVLNYDTNPSPTPSPIVSSLDLDSLDLDSLDFDSSLNTSVPFTPAAPEGQNATSFESMEEELELDLGNGTVNATVNATVPPRLPPPPAVTELEDDFLRFMNSKDSLQVSVVVMMLIYFLCGLTLAILLLSAAQERHLQKLTVWMILQSLVNVVRLILFILLVYWMKNTDKRVDVVMYCLLINFYSFTVLSIVHAHRQDILSLYKRDSRSRVHRAAANDGGILKQRFIRNVS